MSHIQDKCVEFGSVEDKGGAIGVAGVAHSDQSMCQSGEFGTIPIRVTVATFAPYRAAQQGYPCIVSGSMHPDIFAGLPGSCYGCSVKQRGNQVVTVPTSSWQLPHRWRPPRRACNLPAFEVHGIQAVIGQTVRPLKGVAFQVHTDRTLMYE